MSLSKKVVFWVSLFFIFLILLSLVSLMVGPAFISFQNLWDPNFKNIVWDLRFRRILIALTIGGSLSLGGTLFQVLFKNPLVDPYILGISSASAFGAALSIPLHLAYPWPPLLSFLMTLVTLTFILWLSKHYAFQDTFLLGGILLSFLFSSFVTLILTFSHPFEGAELLFWLMGTVSQPIPWGILLVIFFLSLFLWIFFSTKSHALNLLNLGEEEAQTLGLPLLKTKRSFLFLASLLTALSVSLGGTIGFVGLVAPHMVRTFFGEDFRLTLPLSILGGGLLLIFSDTLIRLFSVQEIPIGVITTLFGVPYFFFLFIRKKG